MAEIGEFTAAGQVTEMVTKGDSPVNLSITGGSGTFAAQWFVSNAWSDVETFSATGLATAFTNVGRGTSLRAKCVTFVSGPIAWSIG